MLKLLKRTTEEMPPQPTPAEVAEHAKRTADHLLLEGRLDRLRDQREANRLAVQAAHAASASNQQVREAKLKSIHIETEHLENEIREVRRQLQPHRLRHAERVEAALKPMRTETAKRVRDALAELHGALAELNTVHAAGRRWGVDWPTATIESRPLAHAVKHI